MKTVLDVKRHTGPLPEQFEESADNVGFHTDIYLVGACLFHAINGAPPQPGRQLAQIRAAMLAREEVGVSPGTPEELVAIVNKARPSTSANATRA